MSADLVTWNVLEPALGPHPGLADADGAWSGNVVNVDGVLTAFYSGFRESHPFQSVLTATSSNGGASFDAPRTSIPDPHPAERVAAFRDPFVWSDAGIWRAVVGAGYEGGARAVRLYESPDALHWMFAGDLIRSEASHPASIAMWECPQVIRFGDKWFVLAGEWTKGLPLGPVRLVEGLWTGHALTVSQTRTFDYGSNFYAASVQQESSDSALVWGWVTEGRASGWYEDDGWAGAISFPRRVRLEDGELTLEPAAELTRLRAEGIQLVATRNGLEGEVGDAFELELKLAESESERIDVSLRFGRAEALEVRIDSNNQVSIDSRAASRDSRATGSLDVIPGAPVRESVRVLVDGSIIEVFTSDGLTSTSRAYPLGPPPWTLEVRGARAEDASVWKLAVPQDSGPAIGPVPETQR